MFRITQSRLREIIKEELEKIEEDYPASFEMDKFKAITSFRQRVAYCEEQLQRLGSGSARIVYAIDNEKVLKLAKNQKGIAQNEAEANWYIQEHHDEMVTKLFDYHHDDHWIEMERASKARVGDFKRIAEIDFRNLDSFLRYYEAQRKGRNYHMRIDKTMVDEMYDNEWVGYLINLIDNCDMPVGDLTRISSYGIVRRGGQEMIVLTDYGLTQEIYDTHYSR